MQGWLLSISPSEFGLEVLPLGASISSSAKQSKRCPSLGLGRRMKGLGALKSLAHCGLGRVSDSLTVTKTESALESWGAAKNADQPVLPLLPWGSRPASPLTSASISPFPWVRLAC